MHEATVILRCVMHAKRIMEVFCLMNLCCGSNKRTGTLDPIEQPAARVFLTLCVCLRTDVCLCVCVLGDEGYISHLQGDLKK